MSTIGESAAMGTAGVVIWERSETKLEVNCSSHHSSLVKFRQISSKLIEVYLKEKKKEKKSEAR